MCQYFVVTFPKERKHIVTVINAAHFIYSHKYHDTGSEEDSHDMN